MTSKARPSLIVDGCAVEEATERPGTGSSGIWNLPAPEGLSYAIHVTA
jgi:hypothetical protein